MMTTYERISILIADILPFIIIVGILYIVFDVTRYLLKSSKNTIDKLAEIIINLNNTMKVNTSKGIFATDILDVVFLNWVIRRTSHDFVFNTYFKWSIVAIELVIIFIGFSALTYMYSIYQPVISSLVDTNIKAFIQ